MKVSHKTGFFSLWWLPVRGILRSSAFALFTLACLLFLGGESRIGLIQYFEVAILWVFQFFIVTLPIFYLRSEKTHPQVKATRSLLSPFHPAHWGASGYMMCLVFDWILFTMSGYAVYLIDPFVSILGNLLGFLLLCGIAYHFPIRISRSQWERFFSIFWLMIYLLFPMNLLFLVEPLPLGNEYRAILALFGLGNLLVAFLTFWVNHQIGKQLSGFQSVDWAEKTLYPTFFSFLVGAYLTALYLGVLMMGAERITGSIHSLGFRGALSIMVVFQLLYTALGGVGLGPRIPLQKKHPAISPSRPF